MRSLHVLRLVQTAVACLTAVPVVAAMSGCGSGLALPLSGDGGGTGTALALTKGPQLGYVWNSADQTLRPILGVPGAAQFGASITPAKAYANAAAAGSLAVAVAPDGSVDQISLPDGASSRLPGTAAAAAQIRVSATGTSALFFTPGSTALVLFTGIGATAQAHTTAAPGPVLDAAVSDTGSVALAVQSGTGAAIQVVGSKGALQRVGTAGSLGGLSFAGSGEDLVFADAQANTVTLVQAASTAPAASTLPTGTLLAKPVSLATSMDGRWAVVANGADRSVVRVALKAQAAPQRITCSCQPSVVAALTSNGAFRLTSLGTGPVWIADTAASSLRTVFIPALSPDPMTQTAQQNAR